MFVFWVVRYMYVILNYLSLIFKISLQRVLWLLIFWIMGILTFLRYAWIRVTGLFIHGFQEREDGYDDDDGRRI